MKLVLFSYSWIMRHLIQNSKTVLDVGCGDGDTMASINFDKKFDVTGIDLYRPSLDLAKKTGVYKKLLYKDIRQLKKEKKKYDVVFSSQVVEHLTKREALKLIKVMESLAKDKVIIGTTNGFFPFHPIQGEDKNPLQIHKSGWDIKEFEAAGYKVYGQGTGFIYKPWGLAHKVSFLNPLWFLLSYSLSPLQYVIPQWSAYIIAVKSI